MESAIRNGLATIADFVPRLVLFLVILVVGFIVAKLVAKAINALLERVGFDRAVERGGVKKAMANSKMDASDVVGKLIYYTLALFVLQLAFGVFGPNPISDLITQVITFLPSLIVAIIILVVAAAIAAAVKTMIQGTLGGLSYGKTLANAASIFILFLGIVAALNQIGVATTVTTPVLIAILAAVVGVIVVGVGGGLIKPMQHRWEGYLSRAEQEAPRIKEQAANAPSIPRQAQQAGQHLSASESALEASQTGGGSSIPSASQFDSTTNTDSTRQF
jgi:small-conductance mechanosensitive channel